MELRPRPARRPAGAARRRPALGDDEAGYVAAARAANTLKGYRSDWAEWCSWCAHEGLDPLAGEAAAISQVPGVPGRRRGQGGHHGQAPVGPALRLPDAGPARPDRGGPGGGRVGRYPPHPRRPGRPGGAAHAPRAARRRWRPARIPRPGPRPAGPPSPTWPAPGTRPCCSSASSAPCGAPSWWPLDFEHVNDHPQGLVVTIPRSKTNQEGIEPELVVLPIGPTRPAARCGRCAPGPSWPASARARSSGPSPPATRPSPAASTPETRQLPRASRHRAGRHRPSPLLGPFAAGRLRHLRPPAGRQRPGHRPPDPAPLHGDPRAVREDPRGVAGQRRHAARAVSLLPGCTPTDAAQHRLGSVSARDRANAHDVRTPR